MPGDELEGLGAAVLRESPVAGAAIPVGAEGAGRGGEPGRRTRRPDQQLAVPGLDDRGRALAGLRRLRLGFGFLAGGFRPGKDSVPDRGRDLPLDLRDFVARGLQVLPVPFPPLLDGGAQIGMRVLCLRQQRRQFARGGGA